MQKKEFNLLNAFKNEMLILKLLPIILAILHFVNIMLQFNGILLPIISIIGGIGFIPITFLYISSYVFKFCYYHRISLHYLLISQILLILDEYIGIPIDLYTLLIIHISLFLWLILSLIYFKSCLLK